MRGLTGDCLRREGPLRLVVERDGLLSEKWRSEGWRAEALGAEASGWLLREEERTVLLSVAWMEGLLRELWRPGRQHIHTLCLIVTDHIFCFPNWQAGSSRGECSVPPLPSKEQIPGPDNPLCSGSPVPGP